MHRLPKSGTAGVLLGLRQRPPLCLSPICHPLRWPAVGRVIFIKSKSEMTSSRDVEMWKDVLVGPQDTSINCFLRLKEDKDYFQLLAFIVPQMGMRMSNRIGGDLSIIRLESPHPRCKRSGGDS